MLLYNALTSVVLGAARLDGPRAPAPAPVPEPKPFRLSHNPLPPVPYAAIPFSTPVAGTAPAVAPVRLFGRLLVEE